MLDPTRTADLLAAHFPGLAPALHAPATYPSVHRQLACFAAYTRAAATADALLRLQRCFAVADRLRNDGDTALAAAIESGYLHCLHLDGTARGNQLARQLMPSRLYSAYAHQHYAPLP
ncbi:DUF7674 family protein [Hymenobacter nivis]|uniref:DUF7674 domain-containing protein n=1 Tax=Hymenobacter nivis TaxID=1850093 RepID=A0A2Z3GMP6_9BACT|nr:hypothetical protein [Hymenobacter nivis]AWM33641.1 hypothetical protein DDQ68_13115 [Hymenobacter nivis]